MRIFSGLLAAWCWIIIVAFMSMYFFATPEYDSSGFLAMSIFILYFAVDMTVVALVGEDNLRRNDMDLALFFWPIILVMLIVTAPFVVYMVWKHEEL